jgi:hypothetical protein
LWRLGRRPSDAGGTRYEEWFKASGDPGREALLSTPARRPIARGWHLDLQQKPIGLRGGFGGGLVGSGWDPQPLGSADGKIANTTAIESDPTRNSRALTGMGERMRPGGGFVNACESSQP